MNWLDILLIVILAASVIGGLAKGFARAGLGFAATIVGLFCGLWFYGLAGAYVRRFVGSEAVADLIGFFLIFIGVVLLGALLGYLLEKIFKLVHLTWLDRLLGGAFGVLRGALIAAVIVLAILAFSKTPPRSVAHSRLAPYVIDAAGAMAAAAPHEIREGFSRSCERVKKLWADALKKGVRRLPEQEIRLRAPERLVTIEIPTFFRRTPSMARVCEICGKGPRFGNRISHAHNVTSRRWNVNLQTVRAIINGAAKRVRVCTACLRSGKVQKAA